MHFFDRKSVYGIDLEIYTCSHKIDIPEIQGNHKIEGP